MDDLWDFLFRSGDDLDELNRILDGITVFEPVERRGNHLMIIAAQESPAVLATLLARLPRDVADVNAQNGMDSAPLHFCTNRLDNVRLLLEHGANPNVEDFRGATPLFHAKSYDVVMLLLEYGADPLYETFAGNCLFDKDDPRCIHELVKRGANPGKKYNDGSSAIVWCDRWESVAALLEYDVDVNAMGWEGVTPLHIARGAEWVQALIARGAKVDAADWRGNTPLHTYVIHDPTDTDPINILIASGADIHAKNRNGDTPLDLAPESLAELMKQWAEIPHPDVKVAQ